MGIPKWQSQATQKKVKRLLADIFWDLDAEEKGHQMIIPQVKP